jgi:hypothetical protein
MRKQFGRFLLVLGVAVVAMFSIGPTARAVDTMADWEAQNTHAPAFAPDNNYDKINNTTVGGQVQSKINFGADVPGIIPDADREYVYLRDPTLSGPTLDYRSPLHMEGKIIFENLQATEPNFFFGWFYSGAPADPTDGTNHRIGFGLSNRTVGQGGAIPGHLRVDFGYGATLYQNPLPPNNNLSNKFYYVSPNGAQPPESTTSVAPNGAYHFEFDYTPGDINGAPSGVPGGMMSASITNLANGTYFRTVQPLETEPEDTDFFSFDRFGIVQRTTGQTTQLGFYNVKFADVSYTGGTPVHAGDFDADGDVDGADFVAWQTNFPKASGALWSEGDADGDFDVDGADFVVWQTNFPFPPGPGSSPVPEPGAILLLAIGGAIALARSIRRRK